MYWKNNFFMEIQIALVFLVILFLLIFFKLDILQILPHLIGKKGIFKKTLSFLDFQILIIHFK